MGTNGLITIVKDGAVWGKIVMGCDAQRLFDFAQHIAEHSDAVSLQMLEKGAKQFEVGCSECLTIYTRQVAGDFVFYPINQKRDIDIDYMDSHNMTFYKSKYDVIGFNPRWGCGEAAYNYVVDLDKKEMTEFKKHDISEI